MKNKTKSMKTSNPQRNINHWARKAGLEPNAGYRASAFMRKHGKNLLYWKGHNRYWRVDCNGMFQISKHEIKDFDRWALSHGPKVVVPTTMKGFKNAVDYLLGFVELFQE